MPATDHAGFSSRPTKVVSEVLGHASVNLTQNTYIHVIPGMHQQAGRDMGKMLRGAKVGAG